MGRLALLLSLVLVAGLLGTVAGLGAPLATGAGPASAAAAPLFTVTCTGVPIVGTLTLSGSAADATLSPAQTSEGATVSLAALTVTTDVEKRFAALGAGKPLTLSLTMDAALVGGTPASSSLAFTGTVTDPATAATIPKTGLAVTAAGTAAPSSFTVISPSGALAVDIGASTAAASPTTTLLMVVNGGALGPYHCTNPAEPLASTTAAFTVTCAGVPIVGTLTLSGSVVAGALTPAAISQGATVSLGSLTFTTDLEKRFAALGAGKPLTLTLTMPAALAGGTPAAATLTFTGTVTVPATTATIPTTGLAVTGPGNALPSSFDGTSSSGALSVDATASTAASPTTTLSMVVNGGDLGPYHCTNPAEQVAATTLAVATASLPVATATSPYSATLAGSGGTGTYALSVGALPAGLTFDATTGVIAGAATTLGAHPVTVSVVDGQGAVGVATLTLTVEPGGLTLSCTEAVTTPGAAVRTCPLVTLDPVTLDGTVQISHGAMPTVYVETARRSATAGWTLTAAMTLTGPALNPNPTCGGAADFCDSTIGTHAATARRGQIPAGDLEAGTWSCEPTAANTDPAPAVGTPEPLTEAVTLCTAAAGRSGGAFTVGSSASTSAGFVLTVPPYVYSGIYYGTVVYTVVSTR